MIHSRFLLHKRANPGFFSSIGDSAFTLAAVVLSIFGVAGAATGYLQGAITKPHKLDNKILQLQQRNTSLADEINRNQILLSNMQNSKNIKSNPTNKSVRVFG